MTADQWTAEEHPNPKTQEPMWLCMAPKSDPLAGHTGNYSFHWLIGGRRGYHFVDQAHAQAAANRANQTTTEASR